MTVNTHGRVYHLRRCRILRILRNIWKLGDTRPCVSFTLVQDRAYSTQYLEIRRHTTVCLYLAHDSFKFIQNYRIQFINSQSFILWQGFPIYGIIPIIFCFKFFIDLANYIKPDFSLILLCFISCF